MKSFLEDLTGRRFGRLIVIGMSEKRTASRGGICICRCDCGTIKEVPSLSLKKGAVISCGCYNKEVLHNRAKHGHNRRNEKSITYRSWDKMMQRCYNQSAHEYRFYGAKGISVCDKWHDFANFLSDMGERPSARYSIDRIDPSGNYSADNCRWATAKTQANNTTRNIYYTYNGERKSIAELADIAGIKYDTMFYRLQKYGWTLEHAMTIPVSRSNSRKGY